MTIGGFNTTIHQTEIQYVSLYHSNYYSVAMNAMKLDEHWLVLERKDFGHLYTSGSILDSGTTFTYLASPVYQSLWNRFEEHCADPAHCLGNEVFVPGESHKCYQYNASEFSTIDEFFDSFPLLIVKIDEEELFWEPRQYLFAWFNYADDYCLGVYNNGGGGSVLGMNFMRGKDVIFDRTNERVGFAEANCDIVNTSPHPFRRLTDRPLS
jgi:hypothetical protein